MGKQKKKRKTGHHFLWKGEMQCQVETIEGYRDLQIPSGTQPGEKLKFANLGVPHIDVPSVRGDHYFIVRVEIPKNIRFKSSYVVLY